MKRSDHQMIQQVLDGSISPEGFERFQERLRKEAELGKLYGEYALLHHSLCEEYGGKSVSAVTISPPPKTLRFSRMATALAIAALLLSGLFIFRKTLVGGKSDPAIVAALEFSPDAVWQIDGDTQGGGKSSKLLQGGTLQLIHGQAKISLNPAAWVWIDAPSIVTFLTRESLHLAEGNGRFQRVDHKAKLQVTTPSISVSGFGTEFGITTHQGLSDELHVFEGQVNMRLNGHREGEILSKGEAGRVVASDRIERIPAVATRFIDRLGEFEPVVSGPFVKANWRQEYGTSSISPDRIEGLNYSVHLPLPQAEPTGKHSILLVTLGVAQSSGDLFHTDGWAGMSFFYQGTELLFFGDAFGPERTWSLDVKQQSPIILPGNPLVGPRTVTLRYDRKTGEVSLHEGRIPLRAAFCAGKLPAGTVFDELRIGASSIAGLTVRDLTVLAGGEAP